MSDKEVCRAFRNKGKCRYGDDCQYEHSEGDVIPAPPRGECFTFKETGECNFGDRCRFTHGGEDNRFDEDGNRVSTGKKSKRTRKRSSGTGEKTDVSEEVCNTYLQGKCRYGDQCRRKHEGDVPQVPVEKIDEVCRNFGLGKCRFGDRCRRQHEKAD